MTITTLTLLHAKATAPSSSILVTGAGGYLGKHLVRSLLADGYHVVGVDNFITSNSEDLHELRRNPRFDFYTMDICSRELARVASEYSLDQIFHLACPTGVPNLGPLAVEMLETCTVGTANVLAIARAQEARCLLTSSAEVYGDPQVTPQDESYLGNVDALGGRKAYEEGKRVAETWFGIYAERFGVEAVIARVFNSYGPGMSLTDARIVPAFTAAALRGSPIPLHGDGAQVRCYAFVEDTMNGLRRVMEAGRPARPYNIGSTDQVSALTIATMIKELSYSDSEIVSVPRPSHDTNGRLPDIGRAREELGWEPRVRLRDGLQQTIADFAARLHPATLHAIQ